MTPPLNPKHSSPAPPALPVSEDEKDLACKHKFESDGAPCRLCGKTVAEMSVEDLGEKDAPSDARYVVGFVFDPAFQSVALIRKNKPRWQAGKLNGIGGKIEDGEEPTNAMRRECIEEAGLDLPWNYFASLSGTNNDFRPFALECFWTTVAYPKEIRSQESEQIETIDLKTLSGRTDTIGNLPWLILLARDFGTGSFPPRIVNAYYGQSDQEGNVAGALPVIPKDSPSSPAAPAPTEQNLRQLVKDACDDDTAIRELARPILGDFDSIGNTHAVPPLVEVVEMLIAKLSAAPAPVATEEKDLG